MNSFILKLHKSFQKENKIKVTRRFSPRLLIFKLQQEVLKLNDIRMRWGTPKLTG